MSTTYRISDGELDLVLVPAEEGGFTVTCPAVPGLVTEAETVSEAFAMARDAREALWAARARNPADGFEELMQKITLGVQNLAASLGVEINAELCGIVSEPGAMKTGCGFGVTIGKGLPPGWLLRSELLDKVASLSAKAESKGTL